MRIPGAQVSIVGDDGTWTKVGKTDLTGLIEIEKADLRGALLILVCTDFTYCTALPTSEPRFFEYDERLVVLAGIRVL